MIRLRLSDMRRPRFLLGVLRRSLRVRLLALVGRDITVAVGDGLRIRLPARQRLVWRLLEDDFERPESDFISRALRPGDVFVDVGAHVGIHTVVGARAVSPGGRVYAFEPNPATFASLERNVAANGLGPIVRCVQAAVSESPGVAQLHVPHASYSQCSSLAVPHVGVSAEVEVATARLDDLTHDRPTLVKIDVEGWERHVLAGGRRLFSSPDAPHLLVEFGDVTAANAESTSGALADDLERLGYRLFRYDSATHELRPEQRAERYGTVNLVATKRADELAARLS